MKVYAVTSCTNDYEKDTVVEKVFLSAASAEKELERLKSNYPDGYTYFSLEEWEVFE